MGMYNFQRRFVPFILAGIKSHTIRARRKYEDRVGNVMHLYMGLRTPDVELLARTPCIQVGSVLIPNRRVIKIDGNRLGPTQMDRLAIHDGFHDWDEMVVFFEKRFPFDGKIYHWTPLAKGKVKL